MNPDMKRAPPAVRFSLNRVDLKVQGDWSLDVYSGLFSFHKRYMNMGSTEQKYIFAD